MNPGPKRVVKEMLIEDIVREFPNLVPVLRDLGITCIQCGEPLWGTLEENARDRGITDMDGLTGTLNRHIDEPFDQPARETRFLVPDTEIMNILTEALEQMNAGFTDLPPAMPHVDQHGLRKVLRETALRMQDNYPYFHPLYAGQMLKPPHPAARLAYMLAMWINPNNHALDGGRATSAMEKEAVAEIAGMFGWKNFLGHLTGGGTMANLEALWIAGCTRPGERIVASELAHYTHERISNVLKLDFESIPADPLGRMDVQALESALQKGNVGTVVATVGTTGTGSVDPLPEILALREKYGFRLHADAAYGGYYILADNLAAETGRAYRCLDQADSIVIDPHKHGLQPYGCGCILFRDPETGRFYRHDSPYTYFTSPELHLGEISLECSRPGASAAALWATQRLLPLTREGRFAKELEQCRKAALDLYDRLSADDRFLTLFPPELDILTWAVRGDSASRISERSRKLFDLAARKHLHLAVFKYPSRLLKSLWPGVTFESDQVTCLRSCLMKPDHAEWTGHIWQILDECAQMIFSEAEN